MPRDLAPLLRTIAVLAVAIPGIIFALMMKGGAFRGESVVIVLVLAAVILAVSLAALHGLDSNKVRNAKVPNPLHPDNRRDRAG